MVTTNNQPDELPEQLPKNRPDGVSERNWEIVRLRVQKRLTYREISRNYGISQERVRQIVERARLDDRYAASR